MRFYVRFALKAHVREKCFEVCVFPTNRGKTESRINKRDAYSMHDARLVAHEARFVYQDVRRVPEKSMIVKTRRKSPLLGRKVEVDK